MAEKSHKRRRQTVVCTSCRRRKIACDRNAPCAQCIQANLECTYHRGYHDARNDFPTDRHDSAHSKVRSSSSASSMQATSQGYAPESLANVDYQSPVFEMNVASALPAALSVDMSAPSWFETEILGALDQPLGTPIDANGVTLFSPNTTNTVAGLSDAGPGAGRPALPPPLYSESFSAEPGEPLFSKGRVYGPTHWMTILRKVSTVQQESQVICCKYEHQGLFDDTVSVLFRGEGQPLLQKCKELAREVKSIEADTCTRSFSRPLQEYMPPREICDELVRLYLRTFEAVLRVLHVPNFQRDYLQYWINPQAASESLILQLLLVMAIGTCFYQDTAATEGTLHRQATHWIQACHLRLAAPFRKKHLNLRGVQSQCLLVIALLTNTNAVGGDLAWISAASLVQNAMAVGLHNPPSQLPVDSLEAEVRRRLWATILELAVQCSLDSGGHPIISARALNYELPSNLNDSQISDSTETLPAGHPMTTFTQSSIQCALLGSLPIRLRIAEALSRSQGELSYDTALRMGAELTAACRETSKLIDSFLSSPLTAADDARPREFQIKMQDLLTRRFLLLLHAQFAYKAPSDVAYHFSRTVCHECSLLLLSPWSSSADDAEPLATRRRGSKNGAAPWSSLQDYASLQLFGDGLFKNTFLVASLIVCGEVLQQLRDDSSPAASSPPLARRELLQAVEHAARLARRRVRAGETNAKAAALFACLRARIGAHSVPQQQQPQQRAALAAAMRAVLGECCGVLAARLRGQSGPGLPPVGSSGGSAAYATNDPGGASWLNVAPVTTTGVGGGVGGGGGSSRPPVHFPDVLGGGFPDLPIGGNNRPSASSVERRLSDSSLSFDGSETWHASS